jgi:hypothetical protein
MLHPTFTQDELMCDSEIRELVFRVKDLETRHPTLNRTQITLLALIATVPHDVGYLSSTMGLTEEEAYSELECLIDSGLDICLINTATRKLYHYKQ